MLQPWFMSAAYQALVHTIHSVYSTVHSVQCIVHNSQSTVYGAHLTLNSVQCTVYNPVFRRAVFFQTPQSDICASSRSETSVLKSHKYIRELPDIIEVTNVKSVLAVPAFWNQGLSGKYGQSYKDIWDTSVLSLYVSLVHCYIQH